MNIIRKITLGICLFSFQTSWAGPHIDPFVGYIFSGSADIKPTGASTINSDYDGLQFGTRLGWASMGFTYGLEYQFGNVSTDTSGTKSDADITNFGAFFGYEFPILVRAWLTYVVDAKYETSSGDLSGDGFKLGLGYTGFPLISINLSMAITNYTGRINSINSETDATTNMLSVSFPVNLF